MFIDYIHDIADIAASRTGKRFGGTFGGVVCRTSKLNRARIIGNVHASHK
jgi:hypothetical protein